MMLDDKDLHNPMGEKENLVERDSQPEVTSAPADIVESSTSTAIVAANEVAATAEPSQASEEHPAMELPEIPAPTLEAGFSPESLYNPPKRDSKGGSRGWRLFAAAVALVTVSTAIGSGSTYYLMSKYQKDTSPIGHQMLQSGSLQAVAQSVAEQGASVIPVIYNQVTPAVVAISVSGGQGFYRTQGSGSGFVVDPRGYILTNYHVIDGASKITVKFVDNTTLSATVMGTDKSKDLAVLKVDPGDRSLIAAPLGNSDEVQVGELAIAIGNPFGHEFTVTAGIVSALNREITEDNAVSIPGAIQTDAAINPGNSGGPLLNSRGEVIGINTAIDSQVNGNVGVGFAVPVNLAKEILPTLIAGEKVQRPFLGVSLSDMSARTARLIGSSATQGALVVKVEPGSAAEQAGLKNATFDEDDLPESADVIVGFNGTKVTNSEDLVRLIGKQKPGDTATLNVVRGNDQVTLTVTLGSRAGD